MSKGQQVVMKLDQSDKMHVQFQEPSLDQLLVKYPSEHKIYAVPLQFQYLPVEMLSKQFTKFNNPHKYRIHYLGTRPINSFILHKKYGSVQLGTTKVRQCYPQDINKYGINLSRIVQSSFINQGLRTNNHYRNAIFYRAFEGMNPTLNLKEQIIFNSAFQSGNLDCVIKPNLNEFDLFLRIDSNTRGHTQWYHFSIKNGKKGQKIKINICNITKGKTLYEQGMKPYVFSRKMKEKLQSQYSWHQGGQNITFQQKPLRYDLANQSIKVSLLYQLGFQYTFQEQGDEVFFAYSIPFTYSLLLHKINLLPNIFVKKQILGHTFTGLDIPILHISNFYSESLRKLRKKNFLITARIHPGETNSSHMLDGFFDFLVSSQPQANQLRDRANFFIVPMANPDGVVMGNSRTSAAGKDLNREFRSHKFELYPQVHLIKNLAFKLKKKYGLCMYLDFHGHSRKKNTFFYGPPYTISQTQYYKCRVLPKLVQKINSSFRYYSCAFSLSQEKRKTARGVMFQQFKIPYTYTIQSSIGMYYDFQGKLTVEFEEKAWALMGKNIGQGLSQFITLEQQYEQLMKERASIRIKAKQQKNKQSNNKMAKEGTLLTDIFEENNTICETIKDKQNDQEPRVNIFESMLQEVKQQSINQKKFDQEVSSDEHDANQDLEDIKLNQFNNLIVQSIHKGEDNSTNNQFYDDVIFQTFSGKKLQSKHTQLQIQVKSKKQSNTPSLNTRFRNRQVYVKSQSCKTRNQSISADKNSEIPYQTKTQVIRRPQKNFIIANKQRYSITTKNFLINESNRYQIIQLPKNIQNIRKQLTKGRILINNLFQNKLKTQRQRQIGECQALSQRQGCATQRNVGSFRLKQSQFSDKQQQKQLYPTNFQRMAEARSNTRHMSRKTLQNRQNARCSPKIKRTIDEQDEYKTLAGIQVDNIAMTIKSFKRC